MIALDTSFQPAVSEIRFPPRRSSVNVAMATLMLSWLNSTVVVVKHFSDNLGREIQFRQGQIVAVQALKLVSGVLRRE
jgi:precorrin-6B methylase 1